MSELRVKVSELSSGLKVSELSSGLRGVLSVRTVLCQEFCLRTEFCWAHMPRHQVFHARRQATAGSRAEKWEPPVWGFVM